MGIPLIYYQRVLGVLAAWKQRHRPFGKDDVTFFVTIAPHLAKAIHEAEVADEVNRMLSGEVHDGAFIQGIPAAGGLAIGTVALLEPLAELDSIPDREVQDVVVEEATFRTAVADVQRELGEAVQRLAPDLSKDVRELFDVPPTTIAATRPKAHLAADCFATWPMRAGSAPAVSVLRWRTSMSSTICVK